MKADGEGEPLISIVVPAYNEEEIIRRGVLQEMTGYLASRPYSYEVLVVDDGSEDQTPSLVEAFCQDHPSIRLKRNEHRGKGHSVISGLSAARGRHLMFMDVDLAMSLEHIDELLDALQDSADVVIGSRRAKGAVVLNTAPWSRLLMSRAFNLLIQALLLPGCDDTQNGFKGFRRDVAHDLIASLVVFKDSPTPSGPRLTAFDVELLVIAREHGYRIHQLPVTWRHIDTRRVYLTKEPFLMLREVLSIWWARLRGKYRPRAAVGPR